MELKMISSQLRGKVLNWAVAQCAQKSSSENLIDDAEFVNGIIKKEEISAFYAHGIWSATLYQPEKNFQMFFSFGETKEEACLRVYVMSIMGAIFSIVADANDEQCVQI